MGMNGDNGETEMKMIEEYEWSRHEMNGDLWSCTEMNWHKRDEGDERGAWISSHLAFISSVHIPLSQFISILLHTTSVHPSAHSSSFIHIPSSFCRPSHDSFTLSIVRSHSSPFMQMHRTGNELQGDEWKMNWDEPEWTKTKKWMGMTVVGWSKDLDGGTSVNER